MIGMTPLRSATRISSAAWKANYSTAAPGSMARGQGVLVNQVFVLNGDRTPLSPTHPANARKLWKPAGLIALMLAAIAATA